MTDASASNRQVGRAIAQRVRRLTVDRARIDTRSLAVFRVLVGLLVIADLLLRSRNFHFFYTEGGVVPQYLAEAATSDGAFSIYYVTTDPTLTALLFVVQGLIALQLIVGFKTRIATIFTFLFVVSLDHHNPFVLSYADTLFRLLLFWAIFLPLGERWSIDAVHADRSPRIGWAHVGGVLAMGQMVVMYVVNGYHKSHEELWTGGEATPLIMGLDNTTFLFGELARNVPTLLQYGGLTWYYMLLASPLLLLLTGRLRLGVAATFFGGHAAFALTVRIGAFPYVAFAGLLLFLQTAFWTDLRRVLDASGVGWERRYESVRTRLSRLAERVPNLRFDEPGHREAKHLFYTTCVGVVLGSILLAGGSFALHAGGVADDAEGSSETAIEYVDTASDGIEHSSNRFSVWQPDWSIFAPTPRTTDRYHVFPAQTADGERIDVYNDRELTFERPYNGELQQQFGTYRERFYMSNVRTGGSRGTDVPLQLAEHLCASYEDEHGVELTHVNMYVIREDVTMNTIDEAADRDRSASRFYTHGCGDRDPIHITDPPF